jgi:hypothetical protein
VLKQNPDKSLRVNVESVARASPGQPNEFLIDPSCDVGQHARPKHLGFPLNRQPRESEIVDAVFQSESIRGEPVESCKLRYFNSFEFFDHTG